MKKFILWLLYPQFLISEVLAVLVILTIGNFYSSFWPNVVSRSIVVGVLFIGTIVVGFVTFFKRKSDVDDLSRRSIQGIGMVLIFSIMVKYYVFPVWNEIRLDVVGVTTLLLFTYVLVWYVRSGIMLVVVVLMLFGGRLQEIKFLDRVSILLMLPGLAYFSSVPEIQFPKFYKISSGMCVLIALIVMISTKSILYAFIASSVSLEIFDGIQTLRLRYF